MKKIALILCVLMCTSMFSVTPAFAETTEPVFDSIYKNITFEEYEDGTGQGNDRGINAMNMDGIIKGASGVGLTHNGAYARGSSIMMDSTGNKYVRFVNAGESGADAVPFTDFADYMTKNTAQSFIISYDLMLDLQPSSEVAVRYKTSQGFMMLFFKDDKLYCKTDGSTGWVDSILPVDGVTVTAGEWNKISYSYSGGKLRAFFNDILIFEKDGFTSPVDAAYSWLYFGAVCNVAAMCVDNLKFECYQHSGEFIPSAVFKMCDDNAAVTGNIVPAAELDITLSIKDESSNLLYTKKLTTDADGKFMDSFTLDKPLTTNNSTVNVEVKPVYYSQPFALTFKHHNEADVLSALDFTLYNGDVPVDIATLKSQILADTIFYNLDLGTGSDFSLLADGDLIFKNLCGMKYLNVTDFNTAFNKALTFQFLRERTDPSEISQLLENNTSTFGYDLSGEFQNYKLEISELLMNNITSITDEDSLKEFIKKAETYYVLTNSTKVQIPTTVDTWLPQLLSYGLSPNYSNVNESIKVNSAVAVLDANLNTTNNFDLALEMTKLINTMNGIINAPVIVPEINVRPSYSGGGGGGGGFGSVTISKPSKEEDKDTESDNIQPVLPVQKPSENKKEFNDVSEGHWALPAIDFVSKNGIMVGDGSDNFMPENYVTREQMTKIIVEAFDITADGENLQFDDVNDTMWCSEYVKIAVAAGIVNGMGNSEFGIGRSMTRQDMAVMLYRYLVNSEKDFETVQAVDFLDEKEISDYAKEAVKFMQEHNLMVGSDGRFNPKQPLTRAMVAKVIFNLMAE